jgi:UDP-N-acetylmuramate dehydrogenase
MLPQRPVQDELPLSAVARRVRLAAWTTLGLGGDAPVVEPASLAELLAFLRETTAPFRVLAGGSNLVIGDGAIDETVLRIGPELAGISVAEHRDYAEISVEAGHPWDAFVAWTVAHGWSGLEALSGIPGSVGATPIQNVGAYGSEVADRLVSVRAWDRSRAEVVEIPANECGFSYRHSRFRDDLDRFVILAVTFRLDRCAPGAPVAVPGYAELRRAVGETADGPTLRATVIALRRGKGMVVDAADPDSRSAGSFFTNPIVDADQLAAVRQRVADRGIDPATLPTFAGPLLPAQGSEATKLSAAWLIERAGFPRGFSLSPGAHVSRKHTLALVHAGDGTTDELLALASHLRDGVAAAFGVRLTPEPVFWNCALTGR